MVGMEPAIQNQQVVIGAGSNASGEISAHAKFVRLHTDAACRYAVGVAPVATAASPRLAANGTEFIGLLAPNLKIAVISAT
jgi:hypothetical protein